VEKAGSIAGIGAVLLGEQFSDLAACLEVSAGHAV